MTSSLFLGLEKFSDGNSTDLNSFLSRFDRCCAVANKVDAETPVKGQLLMLWLEGRARAALEEFELTQGGVKQTYDANVAKLREYFDSASSRQSSMILFEGRKQKIQESEEEFMLDLLRLYKAANPDHSAEVTLLAIKRKFIAGISPTLRNKIFIFCADPYANGVTRDALLGHCVAAKNLLAMDSSEETNERSSDRVLAVGAGVEGENSIVAALNNVSLLLSEHIQSTDARFDEFGGALAAITQNNNNFRGRNNRGNRGFGGYNNNNRGGSYNNRGNYNNNNRNNSNRGGFNNNRGGFGNRNFRGRGIRGRGGIVRCFNCQGENHVASNCTAGPSQGN